MASVDLVTITQAVVEMVAAIAIPVALAWIRSWKIDDNYKNLIANAVTNGAGVAKAYLDNKIDTNELALHPQIKQPEIAAAVQYVINHVPDAVKYFDLTPDQLSDKVISKLGLSPPAATLEAVSAPVMGLGEVASAVPQIVLQLHLPDGSVLPIPQNSPAAAGAIAAALTPSAPPPTTGAGN